LFGGRRWSRGQWSLYVVTHARTHTHTHTHTHLQWGRQVKKLGWTHMKGAKHNEVWGRTPIGVRDRAPGQE